MQARGERGPVHRPAAHALAAVVGPEGERIAPAGDPRILPVQPVRAGLVADPVALRLPKRARFQSDDAEAGAGQALQQHAARRTDADDEVVDAFGLVVTTHRRGLWPIAVDGNAVHRRRSFGSCERCCSASM